MMVGFRLPGQVVPRNRRKGFFLIPLHVLFLSTGRIASGLLVPLTAFSSSGGGRRGVFSKFGGSLQIPVLKRARIPRKTAEPVPV